MSYLCCHGCGQLIDTDEDCEAWIGERTTKDGRKYDLWLCPVCREEEENENE